MEIPIVLGIESIGYLLKTENKPKKHNSEKNEYKLKLLLRYNKFILKNNFEKKDIKNMNMKKILIQNNLRGKNQNYKMELL